MSTDVERFWSILALIRVICCKSGVKNRGSITCQYLEQEEMWKKFQFSVSTNTNLLSTSCFGRCLAAVPIEKNNDEY